MGRPPATSEIDRHTTCRNLVWEAAAAREEAVPGRYCANRLGVIHSLDCPVYQGLECCLFDPRAEDDPPELTDEKELDRLRTRLTRDYLRWPYWKRVELLRGPEAPAIVVHDLPDTIEPELDDDDTEPVKKVKEEEPEKPQEKTEELPGERYPGQRRSEDRRKTRRAGESPPPPDADGGFAAGILPEDEAIGVAKPDQAESSAPAKEAPAKDAPAKEKQKKPDPKKRSRRRRPRRRRGRGQGKGGKPGGEKGKKSD